MSEKSFAWDCSPAVGDFSTYTLEIVENTQRIMGNINPASAGVVYWTDSTPFPLVANATDELLKPEFVAGNTVRINTGVGMVEGWIYLNDVAIDTDVSGGNANATDIIGLRRDRAGQTVRLFLGRGAAGLKYQLVQTTATWEVPLVEVTLDGAGNYAGDLDVREFVSTPLYPPQKHKRTYQPVAGAINGLQETPDVFAPDANIARSGIRTNSTQRSDVIFLVDIPNGTHGGEMDITFHLYPEATGGISENVVVRVYTMPLDTEVQTITSNYTLNVSPPGQTQIDVKYSTIAGNNLAVLAGQTLLITFTRDGADVNDTYNNLVMVMGATIEVNETQSLETYNSLPPLG